MKWSFENTYSSLPKKLYSFGKPTPVSKPTLKIFNEKLSRELGLNGYEDSDLFVLSGNHIAPGSKPLSQAYSGHQFGHYTVLGDGRAHLLGEIIDSKGNRYDVQLKGSGQTPYSRSGDGRASLGPMLREYIVSEAMHAFDIPTTRSLAVVTTGEKVYREEALDGAILTRVAKSHLRVGTFEYAASLGETSTLTELLNYTIKRHYPNSKDSLDFLDMVSKKQAQLIAKWMGVGFIHGVMNTDNMSISGETIDYGPCAFLDEYNPLQVFSFIDRNGRYAYGRQPSIALWNLSRFAESIISAFDDDRKTARKKAEEVLSHFSDHFKDEWLKVMYNKIGLIGVDEEKAIECLQDLLNLMEKHKADFTNTFRSLAEKKTVEESLTEDESFKQWKSHWLNLIHGNDETFKSMKKNNPSIIPRNHLVEEALIEALESNSLNKFNRLLKALENPYSDNTEFEDLKKQPTEAQKVRNTFCGT
jgi:uncharacterized protein YdiU (UPF0061 family)